MHFTDTVPESLLKKKLRHLAALYGETDRAIQDFIDTVDFRCSPGCGNCCKGFIPDLLPVESSYIASFLIWKNRETAEAVCREGLVPSESLAAAPTCPLYEIDSPYHCSVYEARPLVCRLFGFSGISGKHGDLSFSLCRFMESVSPEAAERKFRAVQDDERLPVKPPAMSVFGEKLQSLNPNDSGMRQSLHTAVPAAIGRILFLVSIAGNECRLESEVLR